MSYDLTCYGESFYDHLTQPRHRVGDEGPNFIPDGEGRFVGQTARAMLYLWIKVNAESRIDHLAWRADNFASAVASTSAMAELILAPGSPPGAGMKLAEALELKPEAVAQSLGGLSARKIHETIVGPRALQAAIQDLFQRLGLGPQDLNEPGGRGAERVCECLGVTAGELEAAVSRGLSLAEICHKLGTGLDCGRCVVDVKALYHFYRDERNRALILPLSGIEQ